jgi:hypothetical protein
VPNPDVALAAAVALQLFGLLSAIDGLYIHLWKLRLHRRPDSDREHLLHTARAVLFVPVVSLLFVLPTAGILLWIGVALAVLDQVAGVADALSERDSRASLGGLARSEYGLHVVIAGVHVGALALVLAARPSEAWSLAAPATLGAWPPLVELLAVGILVGAVLVAALHVALARPRRVLGWCCAVRST